MRNPEGQITPIWETAYKGRPTQATVSK